MSRLTSKKQRRKVMAIVKGKERQRKSDLRKLQSDTTKGKKADVEKLLNQKKNLALKNRFKNLNESNRDIAFDKIHVKGGLKKPAN